jgi:hypothetical protein
MKTIIISRREALKKMGILSATTSVFTFISAEISASSISNDVKNISNESYLVPDNRHHRNEFKKGWISIYCSNVK